MDRHIKTIVSVCDAIRAKHKGKKDVNLSFDEWGIWNEEERANRTVWKFDWDDKNAISEGSYSFADALLTGSLLMSLIRNCDRVKIACQAQLINHLSPINCAKGGRAWKQTMFYPFLHASLYGRGTALRIEAKLPTYGCEQYENVPALDTAAVVNEEKRELSIFVMNRDAEYAIETDFILRGFERLSPIEHLLYRSDDLKAVNTLANDSLVPISTALPALTGETLTTVIPKASWNVLRLGY
jgi:alpha-N-arabinofuranosidase